MVTFHHFAYNKSSSYDRCDISSTCSLASFPSQEINGPLFRIFPKAPRNMTESPIVFPYRDIERRSPSSSFDFLFPSDVKGLDPPQGRYDKPSRPCRGRSRSL